MLIANLYGRLGQDPVARQTKAGGAMATASVVVDVTARNSEEPASQWFNLLAFGAAADELLRAQKGQMIAALGKLTRGEYTTKAGEVREQWSLMADSVVTVKFAKPTGGRRAAPGPASARGPVPGRDNGPQPSGKDSGYTDRDPPPFDDDLPF